MTTENRSTMFDRLLEERIVAVVRLGSQDDCLPVARALVNGGVHVIEMTMTTPGALEMIRELRTAFPAALVGAGSVLGVEDAERCLKAGASFLVGPVLDPEVLAYANARDVLLSPGTFTPTEAFTAWRLGARLIKVFPAARLGPQLISDLKAPMPFLRLMPTGGITAETVGAFLSAGADVVGAGSWLTPEDAIAAKEYAVVQDRASRLRTAVAQSVKR